MAKKTRIETHVLANGMIALRFVVDGSASIKHEEILSQEQAAALFAALGEQIDAHRAAKAAEKEAVDAALGEEPHLGAVGGSPASLTGAVDADAHAKELEDAKRAYEAAQNIPPASDVNAPTATAEAPVAPPAESHTPANGSAASEGAAPAKEDAASVPTSDVPPPAPPAEKPKGKK